MGASLKLLFQRVLEFFRQSVSKISSLELSSKCAAQLTKSPFPSLAFGTFGLHGLPRLRCSSLLSLTLIEISSRLLVFMVFFLCAANAESFVYGEYNGSGRDARQRF